MNEFTPDGIFVLLIMAFCLLAAFACRDGERTPRESVFSCAALVFLFWVVQERYPELNSVPITKPFSLILIAVTALKLYLAELPKEENGQERD